MSALDDLKEEDKIHKRAVKLKDFLIQLKASNMYKQVIEIEYLTKLPTKLVMGLSNNNDTKSSDTFSKLEAISNFNKFIEDIITDGMYAEEKIKENRLIETELGD